MFFIARVVLTFFLKSYLFQSFCQSRQRGLGTCQLDGMDFMRYRGWWFHSMWCRADSAQLMMVPCRLQAFMQKGETPAIPHVFALVHPCVMLTVDHIIQRRVILLQLHPLPHGQRVSLFNLNHIYHSRVIPFVDQWLPSASRVSRCKVPSQSASGSTSLLSTMEWTT